MRKLALVMLLVAACGEVGVTNDDGGGSSKGDSDGGGQGDTGKDGGTGGTLGKNRAACPIDLPQKLYGQLPGAQTTVEADETWTPDNVYLIFGRLNVKATLTIQPGTAVCFDYAPDGADPSRLGPPPGELDLDENATLKVLGTADKHVVFSQKNGPDQYWGPIFFYASANLAETTMQYLDIYNAGLSASGLFISDAAGASSAPPLDMQYVTFYSIQRVGIKNPTGFTAASRVLVNNYAEEYASDASYYYNYPVLTVHAYAAATVNDQNFRIGEIPTPSRYVQLDHAEGALLDKDVTLHPLQEGLVWRNVANMKMGGSSTPATLAIDPGTVVALNNGGYLYIGGDGGDTKGNIVAVGTAEHPIKFTSDAFIRGETPAAGDWPGIEFYPGNFDASVSKLDYVIFEFGGGTGKDSIYNCNDQTGSVSAEVLFTVSGTGQDYDGPSITHSTFTSSAGQGVRDRCNVGHTGGCLKTDYTAPALSNTFTGFTSYAAEPPRTCP